MELLVAVEERRVEVEVENLRTLLENLLQVQLMMLSKARIVIQSSSMQYHVRIRTIRALGVNSVLGRWQDRWQNTFTTC